LVGIAVMEVSYIVYPFLKRNTKVWDDDSAY